MRVVNDKKNENTAHPELNLFAIVTYSVLTALGMTTLFFAPLPLMVAHERMEEPWPKLTALFGAVLALTYLEVPVGMVATLFVFSLFVADKVKRETNFWTLIGQSALLALFLGAASIFANAYQHGIKPLVYWSDLTQVTVESLQSMLQSSSPNMAAPNSFDWPALKDMLFYQGPFLLMSAGMISAWLSLGVAVHLEWLPSTKRFSGEALRGLRLPSWIALAFVTTLVGSFFSLAGWQHLLGGASRLFATLLFIQGCAIFSTALAQKAVSVRVRTLFYSLAIVFGFYAVIGMGVAGPWFSRKKGKEKTL